MRTVLDRMGWSLVLGITLILAGGSSAHGQVPITDQAVLGDEELRFEKCRKLAAARTAGRFGPAAVEKRCVQSCRVPGFCQQLCAELVRQRGLRIESLHERCVGPRILRSSLWWPLPEDAVEFPDEPPRVVD